MNAVLAFTMKFKSEIVRFLRSMGVPAASVRRACTFRSTVDTACSRHRLLPGLRLRQAQVFIAADMAETRFVVMVPGGAVGRLGVDPGQCWVEVRLTRRDVAIPEIQRLPESSHPCETAEMVKGSHPTTGWRNCLGTRRDPHHVLVGAPK